MSRFRSSALRALERIYGFIDGQPSGEMELGLPIQLVHDTSREAEMGSAYGNQASPGLWIVKNTNTHVGSDTIATVLDPRTPIAATAGFPFPATSLEFDVWLLDQFIWSTTIGIMSSANASLSWPAVPGLTATIGQLTALVDNKTNIPNAAGSVSDDSVGTCGSTRPPMDLVRPAMLPVGTTILFQSVALAVAGDIVLGTRLWVGPRGARPPGTA